MSEPIVRPYRGAEDLRKMQALYSAAYEQTDMRIGDLAWNTGRHTQRELGLDIRIWEKAGVTVGWTLFQSSGEFLFFTAPDFATESLIDEMLATVEGMGREAIAAGDLPRSLSTYGIVAKRSELDFALASGLERNGFTCSEEGGGVLVKDLTALEVPSVAPGFRLATVDTPERVIGRVEAHRAAFSPSEVTRKMYERARRTWPYRDELDQIVETDSGEVVAFCTAWIDKENAAGLLEPVGTRPNYQRRGLASAACRGALTALSNAGARTAQVAFTTPEARALYESLGFALAYDEYTYTKELT